MKTMTFNVNDAVITFDEANNTLKDLYLGNEMFASDGRKVSKTEANDKARSILFAITGLDKKSSHRDVLRAMRKHKDEVFEVIEDTIDIAVTKGWNESEFFNTYVETKNLSAGDENEFWTDDEVYLTVSKVAGNHHDLSLQRLASGKSYRVTTSKYGIAVGADLELFLLGRIDFQKFIDKIAEAFLYKIQNDLYAEVMNLDTSVPAGLKGTGALSSTTKDAFDQVIEDVSAANGGESVVIIGTRTALAQLNKLVEVDWISDSQKEDVAKFGRIGSYQGTTLMEIPQRFGRDVDFTNAQGNLPRLVDNKKLLIVPTSGDKFVKFVDVGETEIYERTETGDTMDDMKTYEVQREFGVACQLGKYHGAWTLA